MAGHPEVAKASAWNGGLESLFREADSGLYAMKRRRVLPAEFRQAAEGQ
jgi:hypothetical protein